MNKLRYSFEQTQVLTCFIKLGAGAHLILFSCYYRNFTCNLLQVTSKGLEKCNDAWIHSSFLALRKISNDLSMPWLWICAPTHSKENCTVPILKLWEKIIHWWKCYFTFWLDSSDYITCVSYFKFFLKFRSVFEIQGKK